MVIDRKNLYNVAVVDLPKSLRGVFCRHLSLDEKDLLESLDRVRESVNLASGDFRYAMHQTKNLLRNYTGPLEPAIRKKLSALKRDRRYRAGY